MSDFLFLQSFYGMPMFFCFKASIYFKLKIWFTT